MKSNLLLLLLLSGCTFMRKPSTNFLKKINSKTIQANIISKNGFYSTDYYSSKYNIYPLFFFENNTVFYPYSTSENEKKQFLFNKEYDYYSKGNQWGVYDLKNDTLNALIFQSFRIKGGHDVTMVEIHYQGIIQDSFNIINWHPVPPYPDSSVIKNSTFERDLIPKNYQFKVCADKYKIDSSKAFINKFRVK